MTDPEQNNPTASESSQDNACGSVLGNESAKIQQDRYRVLIEEVEEKIARHIKGMMGIGVEVNLVEPKSIARSEGKAVRVVDERPKQFQ